MPTLAFSSNQPLMTDTPPSPADVDACMEAIRSRLCPSGMNRAFNISCSDEHILKTVGYDAADPQIPLWEAQFRMPEDAETSESYKTKFAAVQHKLPAFIDEQGVKANEIISEAGLRFIISNHSEHEVRNAISILRTVPVNAPVNVTDNFDYRSRVSLLGTHMDEFFSCLPGLRDIVVSGSSLSYAQYPKWDPTFDHSSSVRSAVVKSGANIFVTHRSGLNRDPSRMDSRFSILITTARSASETDTPGVHLLAPNNRYCRLGTGDSAIINRLSTGNEHDIYDETVKKAVESFKQAATQALDGAAMDNCRLTAILDPGV